MLICFLLEGVEEQVVGAELSRSASPAESELDVTEVEPLGASPAGVEVEVEAAAAELLRSASAADVEEIEAEPLEGAPPASVGEAEAELLGSASPAAEVVGASSTTALVWKLSTP